MAEESARYERQDFNVRIIRRFGVGLVITCLTVSVLIFFFERELHRFFAYPGKASWTSAPATEVPAPRLQVNSPQDLAEMRAQEEAVLHGYGWIDREHGVTRIPIEKAMQLLIERGLPTRQSTSKPAP